MEWLVGRLSTDHYLAQIVDRPDHVLGEVHVNKCSLVVYFYCNFLVHVELFTWYALYSLIQTIVVDCVV